jgi:hypothetical protein
MRWIVVASGLVVLLGFSLRAHADEGIIPLAESGDWAALAHHTSMTAPPDVCLAMNAAQGIALRADENGVQFRVSNSSWSLPAGVQGTIIVQVDDLKLSLDIDGNTAEMVDAEISNDNLVAMFGKMDKSGSMYVTVGKAKPLVVSLAGSTKATNAFRTCAGVKSNAPSAGSNPFQ